MFGFVTVVTAAMQSFQCVLGRVVLIKWIKHEVVYCAAVNWNELAYFLIRSYKECKVVGQKKEQERRAGGGNRNVMTLEVWKPNWKKKTHTQALLQTHKLPDQPQIE